MFNNYITKITKDIIISSDYSISYEQACNLTDVFGKDIIDLILCANKIRDHFKNQTVFTCSIINARSGACSQDCAFCAQSSSHKTNVKIYPLLSEQELVKNAIELDKAGALKYSMVTSGYKLNAKELDTICRAVKSIKEQTDLEICASLGMLDFDMACQLYESGVTNYHHNLETAQSYFDKICTKHEYQEDIDTVKLAASAGLKVCCGGILGLGESWKQRVELAFTVKDLPVHTIPLNFLNPISGTKLEKQPIMKPMDALKSIAIFRFINPDKNITICGGREITLKDYQSWVFMAGANGLMVGNYLTTNGRDINMDIEMINEAGYKHDIK